MPRVVLCPWLMPAPTAAPMWIMGPSGPTGSPEPTAVAADRNFTANVLTFKICGAEGEGGQRPWCEGQRRQVQTEWQRATSPRVLLSKPRRIPGYYCSLHASPP
jgi:hypothetical protein